MWRRCPRDVRTPICSILEVVFALNFSAFLQRAQATTASSWVAGDHFRFRASLCTAASDR